MLNKKSSPIVDAARRVPTRQTHAVILIIAALLIAYLTAAFWQYTQDDVFITYVYSRNIAQGDGFIFNTGQYVQGTTTPLWTLIMAGVYTLTDDLLHAGNFLSAVCLFGVVILALHILENHLGLMAKLFLALTLVTSPLVYVSYGMETLFYCVLLLIGFCLWATGKYNLAMFTAGLLTLVRADGAVLAGTFGLLVLAEWRNPLDKRLWKMSLVYLATIAPWFIFATLYFGTPLPNTLNAKEETLEGIRFLREGRTWFLNFYGVNNPLAEIAVLFVGVGVVRAFQTPALRMVALWACAYTIGYTALNVSAFWYYTPPFVVLVMLMALGAQWLGTQLAQRINLPQVAQIGLTGAFIIICTGLAIARAHDFAEPPPRVATYILAGDWIREHTPEASTLLIGDLGIVGYHAERYTYDSPGLVTPELDIVNNDAYAVQELAPDYVLATQYFSWQQVSQAQWFQELYRPVVQFSTAGDTFSPMTLYVRRSSARPEEFEGFRNLAWKDIGSLDGLGETQTQTWSGGELELWLRWGLAPELNPDYTVFVHVVDANGVMVAQKDGVPTSNGDNRRIQLPANLPSGEYHVRVGWYNWKTQERLLMANGADFVELPIVIENRFPGGSGLP